MKLTTHSAFFSSLLGVKFLPTNPFSDCSRFYHRDINGSSYTSQSARLEYGTRGEFLNRGCNLDHTNCKINCILNGHCAPWNDIG